MLKKIENQELFLKVVDVLAKNSKHRDQYIEAGVISDEDCKKIKNLS